MKNSRSRWGQAVIEYVLLLLIVVTLATVITNMMVSRNSESPGFLIKFWRSVIEVIGSDDAQNIKQE